MEADDLEDLMDAVRELLAVLESMGEMETSVGASWSHQAQGT